MGQRPSPEAAAGREQLAERVVLLVDLDIDESRFTIGVSYAMLQFWVRLYGQVTLEVFGRFPLAVSDPELLFEKMLSDLAADLGING